MGQGISTRLIIPRKTQDPVAQPDYNTDMLAIERWAETVMLGLVNGTNTTVVNKGNGIWQVNATGGGGGISTAGYNLQSSVGDITFSASGIGTNHATQTEVFNSLETQLETPSSMTGALQLSGGTLYMGVDGLFLLTITREYSINVVFTNTTASILNSPTILFTKSMFAGCNGFFEPQDSYEEAVTLSDIPASGSINWLFQGVDTYNCMTFGSNTLFANYIAPGGFTISTAPAPINVNVMNVVNDDYVVSLLLT
jgi:hypothetical protein